MAGGRDGLPADEAGRWQFAPELTAQSGAGLNDLTLYDTGGMPWLFPLDFYNRFTEDGVVRLNGELEKLKPLLQKPFPNFQFTQEQSREVLALQNELGLYVDEAASAIVGADPEGIQEFRQGLMDHGRTDDRFWQEWPPWGRPRRQCGPRARDNQRRMGIAMNRMRRYPAAENPGVMKP